MRQTIKGPLLRQAKGTGKEAGLRRRQRRYQLGAGGKDSLATFPSLTRHKQAEPLAASISVTRQLSQHLQTNGLWYTGLAEFRKVS